MSQVVGQVYKSKIPTLGDDASIQEALRVYHYGVDNYSTQPIPDDSIEGNFRSLNTRVTTIESTISGSVSQYISRVSQTSVPNIITAQSVSTVPITIRAIASQTSNLQQWQDSSSSVVARMSTGGSLAMSGYLAVGNSAIVSNISLSINTIGVSHKGIVVRPILNQTANLQEWQDSGGNPISWVNNLGEIYSKGSQVQTIDPFLLMGS